MIESQTQRKVIGDITYEVAPLGFVSARKVFVRLATIVAPALGALAKGGGKSLTSTGGNDLDVMLATIAEAIVPLVERLRDEDLEALQDAFAPMTTVHLPGNKSPRLDKVISTHFVGPRFGDFFLWLKFCLEVNYGDFFASAAKSLPKTSPRAVPSGPSVETGSDANSGSPPGSTGTSGDSSPTSA